MTGQFKSTMTGVPMTGSGTPGELLAAAAVDAASSDSAARHLLDGTDRQSDRQDASTPTAQRRSAAT